MKKLILTAAAMMTLSFAQASDSQAQLSEQLKALSISQLSGLDRASQAELNQLVQEISQKKVRARISLPESYGNMQNLINSNKFEQLSKVVKNSAEVIAPQGDLTRLATSIGIIQVQILE